MSEWIEATTLAGGHVTLRPLRAEDATALGEVVDDPEPFRLSAVPIGTEAAQSYIDAAFDNPFRVAYAVIDNSTGDLVGSTSFYDIDPGNRSVAIGYTFYAASRHGSKVNPEAKLLLLRYAFEVAGAVRVVWHTDERNARSRSAIAKLGATFEGLLRKHRPATDGGWRTTAQYSMIDEDWPAAKEKLVARIS